MARKTKHTVTAAGRSIVLYGETDKVQEFFPTAQPVSEDSYTVKDVQFKGGTRRRFPGGPGSNAEGGTRKVVFGRPAKQSTLPGNPIKCEVTTGTGAQARTEVTQLTLVGAITAAFQIAKATSEKVFILRSPQGKPYYIGEAEE